MLASVDVARVPPILVASGIEAGSLLAHSINTVKMAEGFARLGCRVLIGCIAPPAGPRHPDELNEIYGLSTPVHWLQTPSVLWGKPAGHRHRFAIPILASALCRGARVVYARSYVMPTISSGLGIPTLVESHAHPDNDDPDFLKLLHATGRKSLRTLVTINPVLEESYVRKGAQGSKILVQPDAVDERLFERPTALPADPYRQSARPRVVYAGQLYAYKGIPAILAAARLLPDVAFHLIGGLPEDIRRVEHDIQVMELNNVTLHGPVPHRAVPPYLWHADVLLLPPSAKHPSAAWTSPVKLGEYMLSGTPIVATDISALRSWVDERHVFFVKPDCGAALAQGISEALGSSDQAAAIANRAQARGRNWTYMRRAENILGHAGLLKKDRALATSV